MSTETTFNREQQTVPVAIDGGMSLKSAINQFGYIVAETDGEYGHLPFWFKMDDRRLLAYNTDRLPPIIGDTATKIAYKNLIGASQDFVIDKLIEEGLFKDRERCTILLDGINEVINVFAKLVMERKLTKEEDVIIKKLTKAKNKYLNTLK